MKNSRLTIVLVSLVALVSLFSYIGHAGKSNPQDTEKSLDIERYPNEPLEIIDIRIGQNAVKNGIRFKSKENISKWGLDNVKFRDKEDWFKNVKVKLRNVSGMRIYGLSASLFFKHPDAKILFQIYFKPTPARDLKQKPLQPGDDIDLEVSEESFNDTVKTIRQYAADPNGSAVSLSVDTAVFSDDFRWNRGSFMRRDPNYPNKWDAVDQPAPPEASRLKQSAGFTLVGFKTASNPPDLAQCQSVKSGTSGSDAWVTPAIAGEWWTGDLALPVTCRALMLSEHAETITIIPALFVRTVQRILALSLTPRVRRRRQRPLLSQLQRQHRTLHRLRPDASSRHLPPVLCLYGWTGYACGSAPHRPKTAHPWGFTGTMRTAHAPQLLLAAAVVAVPAPVRLTSLAEGAREAVVALVQPITAYTLPAAPKATVMLAVVAARFLIHRFWLMFLGTVLI